MHIKYKIQIQTDRQTDREGQGGRREYKLQNS